MAQIAKEQEDKFSWGPGDIHVTQRGEGPSLADMVREQEAVDAAVESDAAVETAVATPDRKPSLRKRIRLHIHR